MHDDDYKGPFSSNQGPPGSLSVRISSPVAALAKRVVNAGKPELRPKQRRAKKTRKNMAGKSPMIVDR